MVILTVKDFGIGMTEDDVEKVFQQFHRGKNVGSVKGTGMGTFNRKEHYGPARRMGQDRL